MPHLLANIVRFTVGALNLNKRLNIEKQRQEIEGYEIDFPLEARGSWVCYREGGRALNAGVEFSVFNDVTLFLGSIKRWSGPNNAELTPMEYHRALGRIVRYLSSWGGEIRLSTAGVDLDLDTIARSVEERGITFERRGDVIFYKSILK